MADLDASVVAHYGSDGLYGRIVGALVAAGIDADEMQARHLKAVDEFHVGGAPATRRLLDPLGLSAGHRVLDIGCGIGGSARLMTEAYGVSVTGVDLTPEFIETARRLDADLGFRTSYEVASAQELPFGDGAFDTATMIHVGMNLPDKAALFAEVARVLRPGGVFAVYDVMLFGAHPALPLPWASAMETSHIAAPEVYRAAGEAAGFEVAHEQVRGAEANAFHAARARNMATGKGPVAGLPLLMGAKTAEKLGNMRVALASGDIAPVEMVFRLPG